MVALGLHEVGADCASSSLGTGGHTLCYPPYRSSYAHLNMEANEIEHDAKAGNAAFRLHSSYFSIQQCESVTLTSQQRH